MPLNVKVVQGVPSSVNPAVGFVPSYVECTTELYDVTPAGQRVKAVGATDVVQLCKAIQPIAEL